MGFTIKPQKPSKKRKLIAPAKVAGADPSSRGIKKGTEKKKRKKGVPPGTISELQSRKNSPQTDVGIHKKKQERKRGGPKADET